MGENFVEIGMVTEEEFDKIIGNEFDLVRKMNGNDFKPYAEFTNGLIVCLEGLQDCRALGNKNLKKYAKA